MIFDVSRFFVKRSFGIMAILFFPMIAMMLLLTAESSEEFKSDIKAFYKDLLTK
ncbi:MULTISPECIES: hypothetical protein [unclassified Oceanobacillus]|uniref:hypothetical protein n=1 Tax=unclassified Oceanobacillus TaxID=2630292 RepID=UPI001BE6EE13|nr:MULTISPECIES: hypothetical protein [unclassified Oceanobacillus]MBT2601405.1 hypothetical protein [Oceanobacillus sp. ISL-74]MBT2653318.1 hypothetical protein [Oceanobacillus sp. ISL-73]